MKEYKGFLVDNDLTVYNAKTGKKLTPYRGTDGYLKVRRGAGKNKYVESRLHVLYAHCFLENPEGYKYINHKDSDKTNCSLDNLEWCTASYNTIHNYNSGTRLKNRTKLIVETKDRSKQWHFNSIRQCSVALGLDAHKVSRVVKGQLREDYLGYLIKCA